MEKIIPTPAVFAGSLARTFEYRTAGVHQTPQVRWTWTASGKIIFPVLVDQGVIYLVDDQRYVSAIEAASGDLLWRFQGNHPITAMCIEGNRGYVATHYKDFDFSGMRSYEHDEKELLEVDLSTGQLLRSWEPGNKSDPILNLFVWKHFLVMIEGESAHTIHLRTGEVAQNVLGGMFSTPTVYQDLIYGFTAINNAEMPFGVQRLPENDFSHWVTAEQDYDLASLGIEMSEEQVIQIEVETNCQLLVANETLFVIGTLYSEDEDDYSDENLLIALDAATGAVKWSDETVPDFLAAASGLVFLQTQQRIKALDIRTHQSRWSWETNTTLLHHIIADGLLYVFDEQRRITALDISTGETRWEWQMDEAMREQEQVTLPDAGEDDEEARLDPATFCTIADGTLYVVVGSMLYALS